METNGNKLIRLVTKEHVCKGQEISEYLRRDPASIIGYARERKRKVHDRLRNRRSKLNYQVWVTPAVFPGC